MTPTIEIDGRAVTAEAFADVPPEWLLGRIFGGSALGRARVYVDILNRVSPERAARAKEQHYEEQLYFQL